MTTDDIARDRALHNSVLYVAIRGGENINADRWEAALDEVERLRAMVKMVRADSAEVLREQARWSRLDCRAREGCRIADADKDGYCACESVADALDAAARYLEERNMGDTGCARLGAPKPGAGGTEGGAK